jgi:hypothetical protein
MYLKMGQDNVFRPGEKHVSELLVIVGKSLHFLCDTIRKSEGSRSESLSVYNSHKARNQNKEYRDREKTPFLGIHIDITIDARASASLQPP